MNGPGGPQGALRGLLRPGPFRQLLTGQAVSSLGDWVGTVALIAAAFDLTGSPTAVGGVLVLRLVPPLFAAPVGGILADRLDRRFIMISSNLAMAGLIALVPFVNLAGLYIIAFVSEAFALLFLPARDAMVPDLVPGEALPTANGLVMGSSYGAIPVAAALFSGLRLASDNLPGWMPFRGFLEANPLAIPFFFDAATFVFSALMIARIPRRIAGEEVDLHIFEGLTDAFRAVRRSAAIRALASGVGVAMFGGGVLFALGIAYIRDTLGGGDVEFGFLVALWGLGMGAGVGTVHLLVKRGEGYVFQAAVAMCGGILVVMALLPFDWLALLSAFLFGLSFSVAIMLAVTLVQRIADERMRGRLMAGAHMLFRLALAVGALGIGGAAQGLGGFSVGVEPVKLNLDGNQIGMLMGGVLILLGALASGGVVRAGEA